MKRDMEKNIIQVLLITETLGTEDREKDTRQGVQGIRGYVQRHQKVQRVSCT